jgi:hypothetical protein
MFECSDYERRRETVMNGQMVEEVVYEGGETVMGGVREVQLGPGQLYKCVKCECTSIRERTELQEVEAC